MIELAVSRAQHLWHHALDQLARLLCASAPHRSTGGFVERSTYDSTAMSGRNGKHTIVATMYRNHLSSLIIVICTRDRARIFRAPRAYDRCMVDPTLHAVAERVSTYMSQTMRWLIHQDVKVGNEDAAMYALLVRAGVLAAADRGELANLGVTDGVQIAGLRVVVHLKKDPRGNDVPMGNIGLEFIWDETPMAAYCNLPDPEEN